MRASRALPQISPWHVQGLAGPGTGVVASHGLVGDPEVRICAYLLSSGHQYMEIASLVNVGG